MSSWTTEQPLAYRVSVAEGATSPSATPITNSSSSGGTDAVIFAGISLLFGVACRHLLRGTRVPYTVALLVLGIALGSLEYGTHHRLGKIRDGIRLWAGIDPNLLLAVFLPALLFESSFSMEIHQIKRCLMQMILLAGPGVLISTFFLGSTLKLAFPYNWNWTTSLLLGGLLSATDPVSVVALLKDLGASKKLSTIIEGESLMNDGTAIVVFQLFYKIVIGESFNWGAIFKFLAKVSLGAVGIGLAFGIISVLWLGFIFNDTIIEITLTLAVSYTAYFTAQVGADISGVLTVMTLGMFYAAVAKTAFKGYGQQSLNHFWEMVTYIANTLIFILSGVVIAEGVLSDDDIFYDGMSWAYLVLLYVFVQASRFIVVALLYPFLRYFGYGLDWKEATILTWSGLRGAVALALSLSVKRSSESSTSLSSKTGTLFVFFTGGIVFLTLIINGATAQFVLHLLGMDKLSPAKRRVLEFTKYEMLDKALNAFRDLGDDEELGPADWSTVKGYIRSLRDVEGVRVHPYIVSESNDVLDPMDMKDIRIRILNGVQASYWAMLDEGRITQTTAYLLMQSVDEALDQVSHGPLCDWKGLKMHVNFPGSKFLQSSIRPPMCVTYFLVERLASSCCICAAFLRAHQIARRQLHDFIGNSAIALFVNNESEAEGEEARKFLKEVRVTYPQVLGAVKTRQVTYSVLNQIIDYVKNLKKVGLLEEKEMFHLEDAVQTDLKKLLRNPPLIKIPKISDQISVHPFIGALPSTVGRPLRGSAKEVVKLQGVTLYREGSKPNGIWLISSGVVKWTSRIIRSKHSLHPTFTHGSTLGLYEVLNGKPYFCDMITDSEVVCCFVGSDKILLVLRSDPSVEDFLWQESAIILAKMLLPQVFEKMAMQELRALVAERSEMTIYIRGEILEVPQHCVGFLLEGFIKPQGAQDDLITSPAALLPSRGKSLLRPSDASGIGNSSLSYFQGSRYLVETRARVIIFNIAVTARGWEHSGLISFPGRSGRGQHIHQSNASERLWQHGGCETSGQEFHGLSDPQMLHTDTTGEHHPDDSSNESAADEVVVRVDSLSHLSFHQAP